MPVERTSGGTSLIDVLDRVLDKGIVIDAWVRVSLVGIDLITVEARVVVASIDTYLKYSEAVGTVAPVAKPLPAAPLEPTSTEAVLAENAALRARLAATSAALGSSENAAAPPAPRRRARRVRAPRG
jgi:gas vesicle structural protein